MAEAAAGPVVASTSTRHAVSGLKNRGSLPTRLTDKWCSGHRPLSPLPSVGFEVRLPMPAFRTGIRHTQSVPRWHRVRKVRPVDILLTGSSGLIGKILQAHLPHHNWHTFDLPVHDVRHLPAVQEAMAHVQAVVHLAWSTSKDNARTLEPDFGNLQGTYNVLRSAAVLSCERVIIASSVHADQFYDRKGSELLKPNALPHPDSPYGAAKVYGEALSRYFSKSHNLRVFNLRLGGVYEYDSPEAAFPGEDFVWLSHEDCASAVEACTLAHVQAGHNETLYVVSDVEGRIHSLENAIGWFPLDHGGKSQ